MLRYAWDSRSRNLRPIPAGASEEGEPPTPPAGEGAGAGTGGEGQGEPKTFTQEDVNRIAAREKDQGKKAASQELSEQLGVSLEEARAIIQQAKDQQEAQKTEAQRAREAADAEKAKAESDRAAAARDRHDVSVERALMLAGVTDEAKLARVMRMVTVEPGASKDEIQADVDQVKTDFPELFATAGDPLPPRRTPSTDPQGTPPKGKASEDGFSRGAERAKAHSSGGVSYGT